MRVTVYGLWHLGCVTAACLAEAGHDVVGLDLDEPVVTDLQHGTPPVHEPGLTELIAQGQALGRLMFTTDLAAAHDAEVVWVAFDTPVNDLDEANVAFVRQRLDALIAHLCPGTLILISSQVPAGFTRELESSPAACALHFAYSPENLRLGKALGVFRNQERIVVGVRRPADREILTRLLQQFTPRLEWMSVESAEMTKHALNAFLATSVTFINEIARICETVGADAKEVERGLKSEARIGPRAYLGPGGAFAGGTLARDVRFLIEHGHRQQVATPLFQGVLASNAAHQHWLRHHLDRVLAAVPRPVVAVLGLTYKPGTNTLRRSASVELCRWLHGRGVSVQAHDPAVAELPDEMREQITLSESPQAALQGADAAVVATEWPEFRTLTAADVSRYMRKPCVLDPNHFLAAQLSGVSALTYIATGRAA